MTILMSSKVVDFSTRAVESAWHFLIVLVLSSKFGCILPRFRDIRASICREPSNTIFRPYFGGFLLKQRSVILESALQRRNTADYLTMIHHGQTNRLSMTLSYCFVCRRRSDRQISSRSNIDTGKVENDNIALSPKIRYVT